MDKDISLDEGLSRLEEIIEIIEDSEVSLEASIDLYKEGMTLSHFCMEKLNKIEKDVYILTQNFEKDFQLDVFDSEEE